MDFLKGKEGSCGSEETPCKYLQRGIQNVKPNGKVFIRRNQSLSTTVDIECWGGRNAIITNKGNSTFAFKMTNVSNVNLTCIEFKNISIMELYKWSSIIVTNCITSGGKHTVFKLNIGVTLAVLTLNLQTRGLI